MSGTRQKTQTVLAFPAARRSEAPKRAREGTEPPTATRPPERPANPDQRMEVVVERTNLKAALHRVKANKGSPGIDGMTVEQFPTTSRQPTAFLCVTSGSHSFCVCGVSGA